MFGMFGKRKTSSQNSRSIPSLPSTGSAKVSATASHSPDEDASHRRIAVLLLSRRRVWSLRLPGQEFCKIDQEAGGVSLKTTKKLPAWRNEETAPNFKRHSPV